MEINGQLLSAIGTLIFSIVASALLSKSTVKGNKDHSLGKVIQKLATLTLEKANAKPEESPADEMTPTFSAMLGMVERTIASNLQVATQSIALLEDKLKFKEEQLESLKAETEALVTQQRHLEVMLAGTNTQLRAYTEFRESDRLEMDNLKRQMETLSDRLNEANRTINNTGEELHAERERLKQERLLNEALRTERDRAVQASLVSEEQRRILEQDYHALQTELKEVRAELQEVRNQLAVLQSVTVPRAEVDKLHKDLQQVKTDTGTLYPKGE